MWHTIIKCTHSPRVVRNIIYMVRILWICDPKIDYISISNGTYVMWVYNIGCLRMWRWTLSLTLIHIKKRQSTVVRVIMILPEIYSILSCRHIIMDTHYIYIIHYYYIILLRCSVKLNDDTCYETKISDFNITRCAAW